MQRLRISLTVLTLTMLWLIWKPVSGATPPPGETPSSTEMTTKMVLVPESLLRRATAHIDSLTLELRWAHNRDAERDSLWVSEVRFYKGSARLANDRADAAERMANSWWHKHESALWLGVGVGLAAWALQ